MLEIHDIHAEFPESAVLIRQLNVHNRHFAHLYDEFHRLNRRLRQLERQADAGAELAELRKRCGRVKDELRLMLSGEPA